MDFLLSGCFSLPALNDVEVFIYVDFQVGYEGQDELDQLIHTTFTPLFQLEKSLQAHQALIHIGTNFDASAQTSLFARFKGSGHWFSLVEM